LAHNEIEEKRDKQMTTVNISELYDPINAAPSAKFDNPGDTYSGTIVDVGRRDDKHSLTQIPAFTLQLDKPTADGDDYVVILARSALMQSAIGKKARHAGRTTFEPGDWMSVTFVENREPTGGGNPYKLYHADYKLGNNPDDGPIGRGGLEQTAADDQPPF
jgi:hypothetical protein